MSGRRVGLADAEAFLAKRYAGRARDVAGLGGGDWSRAFSFRLDGADLVARFGAWREDFEKDRHAMTFAGPDLPVPAVVEIGDAFGGAYAISERHLGLFVESLDPTATRRVLPALLRALDAMRELPVPVGAGCSWGPDGTAPAQSWHDYLLAGLVDVPGGRVSGWRSRLAASPQLDSLFDRGERALRALLPRCPDIRHVLHVDLLNRNVLVDPAAGRLEAVFDWGCASYGDFLYDVAWLTFWAPWHAGLAAVDPRAAVVEHYRAIGLDVADLEARLRGYEIHIGLVHLAYGAFSGRTDDLAAVARRLSPLVPTDA